MEKETFTLLINRNKTLGTVSYQAVVPVKLFIAGPSKLRGELLSVGILSTQSPVSLQSVSSLLYSRNKPEFLK